MATEPKRIYLDTNVLAYAANTIAPQHRAALEVCRPSKTEQLCVSSQVLAEFYAYITNPSILRDPLDPPAAISRSLKQRKSVGAIPLWLPQTHGVGTGALPLQGIHILRP